MHILPKQIKNAANNMADDVLMLTAYPTTNVPRIRHYEWAEASWTFGYTQKYQDITKHTSGSLTLVRRPSGGGLVRHTNDLTYSIVIPYQHYEYKQAPLEIYRSLHIALKSALQDAIPLEFYFQENNAGLNFAKDHAKSKVAQCFIQASTHDIVLGTGEKIAGAALKRNRDGLLIQGSISKCALAPFKEWDTLFRNFITRLCTWLNAIPEAAKFPTWNKKLEAKLIQQFSSTKWNQKR